MQLNELIDVLEGLAPIALAEAWDNPGLIVEPYDREIRRMLFCLDCTQEIVEEAKVRGAQLILSHHPLLFTPVKRLLYSEPDTAVVCALIRHGIGLYAAHTNLDSALGGVNDALAKAVGIDELCGLLHPDAPLTWETADIGRVGNLKEALPIEDFALMVRDRLNASVRYCGKGQVRRVAVVGGSGGSLLKQAKAAGADVLLTGELKHSAALEARALNICVVEAGHYETERVVLEPWRSGLQAALNAIQCEVDLLCAKSEEAPMKGCHLPV